MNHFKRTFFITLFSVFISFFLCLTTYAQNNAEEYYDEYIEDFDENIFPEYFPIGPWRNDSDITKGEVNALIVRLGFSDFPANESNKLYNFYNNDYLRSLYEGKNGGFGLPYNGLADYLKKSSYGNLSIKIGNIIDVQMNNKADFYMDEYGYMFFYDNPEFIEKLYQVIDISEYDSNKDGIIDALYIWNLNSPVSDNFASYSWGEYSNDYNGYIRYVCLQLPEYVQQSEKTTLNTLIHETGHSFLNLGDYYLLGGYPQYGRADIGNIMGWVLDGEQGDFDGWSKWKAEWIQSENIFRIGLQDGDSKRVHLTPYDSSTSEGKKLAIFKSNERYIAVDFCGGLNNNDFDTSLRKKGFRFYILDDIRELYSIYHDYDPTKAPEGNYYIPDDVELGAFQLFVDGDEIEDLLETEDAEKLSIFDIQTGEDPSFSFRYTKEATVEEDPASDIYGFFIYKLKLIDQDGNQIDGDREVIFEDITPQGVIAVGQDGNSAFHTSHDESTKAVDTVVKFVSVPKGYKQIPDVILHAYAIDDDPFFDYKITTESESVSVTTDDAAYPFEFVINVTLEKEDDLDGISDEQAEFPEKTDEKPSEISGDEKNESIAIGALENNVIKSKSEDGVVIENSDKKQSSDALDSQRNEKIHVFSNITGTSLSPDRISARSIKKDTVSKTQSVPDTGEKNHNTLYVMTAIVSSAALTVTLIIRKKRGNNKN